MLVLTDMPCPSTLSTPRLFAGFVRLKISCARQPSMQASYCHTLSKVLLDRNSPAQEELYVCLWCDSRGADQGTPGMMASSSQVSILTHPHTVFSQQILPLSGYQIAKLQHHLLFGRHPYTKARYGLILGQTASLLPEPPSVICAVKYCHMNSRLHGGQEEAGFTWKTSTPDVSLASAILIRTCSVKWVV